MIEAKEILFGERMEKLNREERIAGGLLMYEVRQNLCVACIAAKRVGYQLPEVITGERCKAYLLHPRSDLPECIELTGQRMSGIGLVVAKSADHHEMVQVRPGQQVL